ncbi:DUF302 domain-containing protein [Nitratiruptor tergarcus]|uniref:Uncharacterized conserved protein, DUF302 family n=1 Tax=Nitratiruptor tergarcus DSM 16512 TaxID=1069081 RepID=A0A1W1WS42_9BACT|nr:DUF302 domain-containing protein [Nitratiruptor tergarcus]SMC08840.1 Uncharacterized conserved protein, DUF302 family [Nitratiruptor tergarcus DSM 16512]
MRLFFLTIFFLSSLLATPHLVAYKSKKSFSQTYQKLLKEIKKHKLKIFAIIDHGKNIQKFGKRRNHAKVIIFGSPITEAKLLGYDMRAGLDLPLRILIFEKKGETFLLYRRPIELLQYYHLPKRILQSSDKFLRNLVKKVCK